MNIVRENKATLEDLLKIEIKEQDYRNKVATELKTLQRKAQMPGFRQGKVPMGIITKMYGKSVLVEEVNNLMIDELNKYIKENEIKLIGEPLPVVETFKTIDWDNPGDMEFVWNIGLAPKVELELSDKIIVDYHRITVEDSVIEQQIEAIARRHGEMEHPESVQEDDVLLCELVELDAPGVVKQDGHSHTANLFVKFVKNQAIKEQFIGKKIEESLEMDLIEAFENETEAASIIAVKKDDIKNYGPLFSVTIKKISRLKPAQVSQDLFDKVFPGKGIETEADFRKEIESQISEQYQAEVDKHFANEVSKTLIAETKLELPEDFIKRWILESPKNELTVEEVERDLDKYADSFRWQFIENHLIETNGVKVTQEEVKEHVAGYIRAQFASYLRYEPEQELVDKHAMDIIKNQEELKKVYDTLFDRKLMALYKGKLKLKEVKMKFDDFVMMVEEKYKKESD